MAFRKFIKKPSLGFKTPGIMGIINLTPDSFSDGGRFYNKTKYTIKKAIEMVDLGADIIDIGAESTRPGAKTIKPEIEIKRLKPVINSLLNKKIRVSVDTRNSSTMDFALEKGVQFINDISALQNDHESVKIIKKYPKCFIILMHMQGTPQTMQKNPKYSFAPKDIYHFLKGRIEFCKKNKISKKKIIIDPGIGFGKNSKHNIQILQNLGLFNNLGCNLLIGLSRKRFISELSRNEKPIDRIPGTIAANQFALDQGADIIRVHDVKEAIQAKSIWEVLKKVKI